MKKITRKTVTMVAAALMTMSALTGCSGKQAVQAVDLTAVSFDEIQKKAREEGQIASVGMPDDWANWKGSWEAITEKYGLKHEDTDRVLQRNYRPLILKKMHQPRIWVMWDRRLDHRQWIWM